MSFFIMFKNKHLVLANGYNVNIINISLGCDSKREIQKKKLLLTILVCPFKK